MLVCVWHLSLVLWSVDCGEAGGKSLVTQRSNIPSAGWTRIPVATPATSCLPAAPHTPLVVLVVYLHAHTYTEKQIDFHVLCIL